MSRASRDDIDDAVTELDNALFDFKRANFDNEVGALKRAKLFIEAAIERAESEAQAKYKLQLDSYGVGGA